MNGDKELIAFKDGLSSANEKSKATYQKWYEKFTTFLKKNNYDTSTENYQKFFSSLSEEYSGKTLWVAYSGINFFLKKNNIKIDNEDVQKFIGNLCKVQSVRKSNTFLDSDLKNFFALDESNDQVLLYKVVTCITIFGLLRSAEAGKFFFLF
jgi:hypothetical protein